MNFSTLQNICSESELLKWCYNHQKSKLPIRAFVGVVTNKPKQASSACWSKDTTRAVVLKSVILFSDHYILTAQLG
jgi:hypothetical protein